MRNIFSKNYKTLSKPVRSIIGKSDNIRLKNTEKNSKSQSKSC